MSKNTPQAESPPDVEIVKPKHDADGNQWTVEKHGKEVSVRLVTKSGRMCSTTAPTEDEARAAILNHLRTP